MQTDEIQPWYFTFGGGHAHPDGYIRIEGTFNQAREEMVQRWGKKWAFQYSEGDFLPQIERYGLYKVES